MPPTPSPRRSRRTRTTIIELNNPQYFQHLQPRHHQLRQLQTTSHKRHWTIFIYQHTLPQHRYKNSAHQLYTLSQEKQYQTSKNWQNIRQHRKFGRQHLERSAETWSKYIITQVCKEQAHFLLQITTKYSISLPTARSHMQTGETKYIYIFCACCFV